MTARVGTISTVGIIGWGRMGAQIGHWLIERGWPVTASDPSPEAQDLIRGAGATESPASDVAASAELVLVVVVDDAQVRAIMSGPGGLIAAASPGTVLAICSSVLPSTCSDLAVEAAERGVQVLDVALVGGERAAEQGDLTLYCGGDASTVKQCGPAFAAFAKNVCHVGPVGAGQVAKAANNVLMWTNIRADVEVLRLARTWGLHPGQLRSVLMVGTGGNQVLADWGLHRLRWPKKDLESAVALAESLDVEVPLIRALQPLMDELSREDLNELR